MPNQNIETLACKYNSLAAEADEGHIDTSPTVAGSTPQREQPRSPLYTIDSPSPSTPVLTAEPSYISLTPITPASTEAVPPPTPSAPPASAAAPQQTTAAAPTVRDETHHEPSPGFSLFQKASPYPVPIQDARVPGSYKEENSGWEEQGGKQWRETRGENKDINKEGKQWMETVEGNSG